MAALPGSPRRPRRRPQPPPRGRSSSRDFPWGRSSSRCRTPTSATFFRSTEAIAAETRTRSSSFPLHRRFPRTLSSYPCRYPKTRHPRPLPEPHERHVHRVPRLPAPSPCAIRSASRTASGCFSSQPSSVTSANSLSAVIRSSALPDRPPDYHPPRRHGGRFLHRRAIDLPDFPLRRERNVDDAPLRRGAVGGELDGGDLVPEAGVLAAEQVVRVDRGGLEEDLRAGREDAGVRPDHQAEEGDLGQDACAEKQPPVHAFPLIVWMIFFVVVPWKTPPRGGTAPVAMKNAERGR